ncbi:hypothetical protein ACFQQB_47595 [Nonomuraea rubra]|uniref:hypothetical protein n=1 Tax=Nonomuraea rubra TaxID=46180 RepID=UPI003610E69A
MAVLLDVSTWEGRDRAAEENHQAVQTVLAGYGWRIVNLPAGTSIASVWQDAANRGRYALNPAGGAA